MEAVRLLVKAGANAEAKRWFGFTPFPTASDAGHAHVVAYLVEQSTNPPSKQYLWSVGFVLVGVL